ncbi:MAG: hypothetical protein IPM02_08105 [Betaproteobacteria bacterium]|nr:hypothetical protein [Betaproteobacteria bacterium]
MHGLSQDEKSKIHAVYVAIFDLPYKIQRKTMLLTTLMGGADWSWRVVGITVGALQALSASKYKYKKGTICRAHEVARIDTARRVFEIPSPLPVEELFDLFWANDRTVITTKSENKTGGKMPPYLAIEFRDGLFQNNGLVGFKFRKKEAEFLQALHKAYKAGAVREE